ncbi:MAG: L,D-transpeptidase family protein [Proteobacteria bacterium]|nr:L,D-transpeptidase family protein [Pseudomonadota bacterium]MDA1323437.1 L,D-transpeptidase family protein [Pseudomonadota bacterium]
MNLTIHPDGRAVWNNRVMRCAVGRSGLSTNKREGDGGTPVGDFPVREVFYRADRLARPPTKLPCRPLQDADGWCDDPADPRYNRPVTLPCAASHEEMMRRDGLYDLVVVLGYNDDPIVAGLGSAIFLHVAAPDFAATEGCVALALADLQEVVAALRPGDRIAIRPGEGR